MRLLSLLVLSACSTSGLEAQLDTSVEADQALIGGSWGRVDPLVRVEQGWTTLCSGTAVSPTEVITAAHCVAGIDGLTVRGGQSADVVEVVLHPEWSWGLDDDIAILRLDRPLEAFALFPTEELATSFLEVGDTLTAAGFGADHIEDAGTIGSARQLEVDVLEPVECFAWSGLCTDGGVCQGDDGGGLFDRSNGLWTFVGMLSNEPSCTETPEPALHTSVLEHYRWLRDTLQEEVLLDDDHGDDATTATLVAFDESAVLSGLMSPGDVDTFRLEVWDPIWVRFDLDTQRPLRIEWTDVETGETLDLDGPVRLSGDVLVTVQGWWGNEETPYSLSIAHDPSTFDEDVLRVTEYLAVPWNGSDANCDGVSIHEEESFVEFVNIGDRPLQVGGAQLTTYDGTVLHTFADALLAPMDVLVLYSGGEPSCRMPDNAHVQVAGVDLFDGSYGSFELVHPDGSEEYAFGWSASDSRYGTRVRLDPLDPDDNSWVMDDMAYTPGTQGGWSSVYPWGEGAFSSVDLCSDTMELGSELGPIASSSTVGSGDDLWSTCATNNYAPDDLVSWTAPTTGCYRFALETEGFEGILSQVDSCAAPEEIDCNGWSGDLSIDAEAGETIYLSIDGEVSRDGSAGQWTLSVEACEG